MFFNNFLTFIQTFLIPLSLSVIGFGVLIIVHEFGHFFFCKTFGIHTPTFSVGFGKPIIEKKIGNTNFRLAKIPFGGYVEIAGLQEAGQGEQEFSQAKGENSFAEKYFWQKALVLLGGIIFNFLFAYIIFIALFMFGGSSNKHGVEVNNVIEKSAAHKAGLMSGDVIIKINDTKLTTNQNTDNAFNGQKLLLDVIRKFPNTQATLLINRKGKKIELDVTFGSTKEGTKIIGTLGAFLNMQKFPFKQAIIEGIKTTNMWIYKTIISIKSLFTKKSLDGAGGPAMILALGFETAKNGLIPLLMFLAIISISLAIFNLLPLGITDGGQLIFSLIEAIIRRPIPEIIRIVINIISIGLFILLAIYLTYKDIYTLFGKKILWIYNKIVSIFN
jgi:regulator of sigma E protease